MRADRLISLMLMLQTRGQMTADALAQELEVSKRTIYRDIDALSNTGVPIYAVGGPGGGYGLLDSYRTSLTGLNEQEIQALFLLIVPGLFDPLLALGETQNLRTLILKLTGALSERQMAQVEYMHQRLHLDASRWLEQENPTPYLSVVQEAAWQDRQLDIDYRRSDGHLVQRTISPYGLVAKAGVWYLVAATENGMRIYRASRIVCAQLTQQHFVRLPDFNLSAYWAEWVLAYETSLPQYPVRLRIGPTLVPALQHFLGRQARELAEQATPDANGWRILDHTFERLEEARMIVLGMGASVRVIAPEELRESVLQYAREIIESAT